MAVTVTHTTAAVGVDSGDSLISKNAWNEGHTIASAAPTLTAVLSGNVSIGTSTWTDVLTLALTSGVTYNVRAYAHFKLNQTTGWHRLRILNGAGTPVAAASTYMNNAAKENTLNCEIANISGGQTIKIQGWSDSTVTNNVQELDGWGQSGESQTRIVASPASLY